MVTPERSALAKAETAVSRVLVYRLGSLGDTVVALPSLYLVARAFPSATRLLLTNQPAVEKAVPAQSLLEGTGLVQGSLTYPLGTRDPWRLLSLRNRIRAWRPEVLVYLAAVRSAKAVYRDAIFFAACGIRRMVGLPLTQRMQRSLPLGNGLFESEAHRLARCLGGLGDARLDDPSSWDLRISNAEAAAARGMANLPGGVREYVAAAVGTKMSVKDWGCNNWREALGRISLRYPGLGLVLVGSGDERDAADVASATWRGPRLNLCGLTSPRQSAALIAEAIAYVGHDTGPMHLAAAAGIPCVAVFSARDLPGVWFPWGTQHRIIYHCVPCANCLLEVCPVHAKKCITSISPDEVVNAAVEILDPIVARHTAASK